MKHVVLYKLGKPLQLSKERLAFSLLQRKVVNIVVNKVLHPYINCDNFSTVKHHRLLTITKNRGSKPKRI